MVPSLPGVNVSGLGIMVEPVANCSFNPADTKSRQLLGDGLAQMGPQMPCLHITSYVNRLGM